MLKSILKASICIVCWAEYGIACATGLGGINVTSSLGQPLKAEIEMTSIDRSDKATLRAKLASAKEYERAGADYPYGMPKLKFEIKDHKDGGSFIKVTSVKPVNEPFVTLMLELTWSSGQLLREYTFLLDPVGYKPLQPEVAEVKPIEPVIAEAVAIPMAEPIPEPEPVQPVVAEPLAETPVVASASAVVPTAETVAEPPAASAAVTGSAPSAETPGQLEEETISAEAMPELEDALSKEEALSESDLEEEPEEITVVRGDTLSKIAAQIKPDDVSLERMLVALYRENAGVFDAHNMNRIRAGKILRVPKSEAVRMLPQADAVEEIRVQAADWNVYRQKLAAKLAARAGIEYKQEATGKISAAVIDKAFADKKPATEVLKLSKGEAPDDKIAAGSGKSAAQEKAIAKEEESIAKSKALKDAQERTAILEKNIQDMKRLEELKKAAVPVSAPASTIAMNAASAPQPASSVAPAKPKPKVVPKVVEEPSLIDQLLADPLYLAGGAVLLLALGGMGFAATRRGKGGRKKKGLFGGGDIGSSTGRIAAPIAPSPETGDFTHTTTQAATPVTSSDTEEVDPIGEADLFLTFGRDTQAEEVLKEALKKNPNNMPVKLKLLSIYANRKDSNSFDSYAREVKESGDTAAWDEVVVMGRELDPSNPLYGGSADAAAPVAESKSARSAADDAPSVDFDLGFGSSATFKPKSLNQTTVVLEAPSEDTTAIMSQQASSSDMQSATMDFDITGTNPDTVVMRPGGNQDQALNMDDLVFDVTATSPGMAMPEEAPAVQAEDENTLAFTLDFPVESKPKAAPARDMGLDEITLNLDQSGSSAGTGANAPQDDDWQEVATKLDLAKAYQEMGDIAGAREILDEVLRDGDAQQRESAQALMQQL